MGKGRHTGLSGTLNFAFKPQNYLNLALIDPELQSITLIYSIYSQFASVFAITLKDGKQNIS